MRRLIAVLTLVCIGACVATAARPVNAAYSKLKASSLSMGKDFSDGDYKQLKRVLERKDCKFLGGGSLNSFTSLQYAGDTTAVNRFVEALSLCPQVTVRVIFFRPGAGGSESDWMVTQEGNSHELVVRINLASNNVKMENLYLPPVKAEKPSEAVSTTTQK
jgi:hypothetical protein